MLMFDLKRAEKRAEEEGWIDADELEKELGVCDKKHTQWEKSVIMKIFEVKDRTPSLIDQLLPIWESSVRATHHFLSEQEIQRIKGYVPQAIHGELKFKAERIGIVCPVYGHEMPETVKRFVKKATIANITLQEE